MNKMNKMNKMLFYKFAQMNNEGNLNVIEIPEEDEPNTERF